MRRPSPSSSDSLQVCRDLRAHRSVATRSMPRSRDRPRRQIRRRSSPGSGGPVTPRPPSPWSPVSSSGCRSSGTRTSRARSTPLRPASSLQLRGRPSLWQRRRGTSDSHSALPPSSSESSGRGATWSPLVSRFWRWPFGRSSATPGSPGQPRALDGLRPNGPARNAQRPGPRRIVVVRADGRTTLAPSLPRPRGTPHRGRRPPGRGEPPLARRPTRTAVADRPREVVVSGRAGVSSHPRRHRRRMPPCAVAPWCRVRRTSPRGLDFVERPVAGARRVRSHRGVAVGVAPEPTFRASEAPRLRDACEAWLLWKRALFTLSPGGDSQTRPALPGHDGGVRRLGAGRGPRRPSRSGCTRVARSSDHRSDHEAQLSSIPFVLRPRC